MQSKIPIAGAIVAAITICAIALAIFTLSQGPGQAPTSVQPTTPAVTVTPAPSPQVALGSVYGTVIDSYGKPLSGLLVTLHIMGYNSSDEQASTVWEIYNLTTTTITDEPYAGSFVFDNVELVPEQKYAYLSTEVELNGTVYSGMTDNFTLAAGSAIVDKGIVLHLPQGYQSLLYNRT